MVVLNTDVHLLKCILDRRMDWADYLPVTSGKIMDGRMDRRRTIKAGVFTALTSIIVFYL